MILVSAGHHAYKKGASYQGFTEYDEAMLWASELVTNLNGLGVIVPFGILKDKVSFINNYDGVVNIAIEIHFNSAVDSKGQHIGNGCETLHYPNSSKGKLAAEMVQDAMFETFKPSRGIKEGYFRMNPKNGVDYFLARTNCVSLILEPEFIHKKELIQSGRSQCCKDIALALIDFSKL